MNHDEAARCLTLMQSAWRGKWTEEQERYWLIELVSYEKADVAEAIRNLSRQVDYTPSLHQLNDAVGSIVSARRRRESEHHALGPGERSSASESVSRRMVAMLRGAIASVGEHNHSRGRLSCPVCSPHGHTNATAFGYTRVHLRGEPNREGEVVDVEHSLAVEGWRFDCPKCGDPLAAQLLCSTWSPAGLAWMREHRPDLASPRQPAHTGTEF